MLHRVTFDLPPPPHHLSLSLSLSLPPSPGLLHSPVNHLTRLAMIGSGESVSSIIIIAQPLTCTLLV